jgi:hypothetical protein
MYGLGFCSLSSLHCQLREWGIRHIDRKRGCMVLFFFFIALQTVMLVWVVNFTVVCDVLFCSSHILSFFYWVSQLSLSSYWQLVSTQNVVVAGSS